MKHLTPQFPEELGFLQRNYVLSQRNLVLSGGTKFSLPVEQSSLPME
jgi:hypothetical protein